MLATGGGSTAPTAEGLRVGMAPAGELPGLDERVVHTRSWWRWGGGRRRLTWLRRWEIDEGREADAGGWWRVARLVEVERPTGRHGQQLDVLVEWAGVDTGTGRAWATSWIAVTQLREDLKLQARSMEAARYPLKRKAEGAAVAARRSPRLHAPDAAATQATTAQAIRAAADETRQVRALLAGAEAAMGAAMVMVRATQVENVELRVENVELRRAVAEGAPSGGASWGNVVGAIPDGGDDGGGDGGGDGGWCSDGWGGGWSDAGLGDDDAAEEMEE